METDSGSEDLDIALFSKKFKFSEEKLNQQKQKTKKNKTKIKEKVRDLNSNSSNRTKSKYDRASDDELVNSNDDSSVKFKEKHIKRKHKNTENLDSEIIASPLKKTKYKNEYEDNVVVEDGLSSKKRWKTEKQQRSSVLEPFVEPPNPKKEQKNLNETIGTSSEESDLETGSFRRKAFNNRVEPKVKQKDIKEKIIKSLKDKNKIEAESDYSDDSRRDREASPSDSESSDGDTDQESDAKTSEMEPGKNLVFNEYKGKVKGQQKRAKSNAAMQSNEGKLVKVNLKKKTKAVESDSSSDINTDTSDGEETHNESLESDSDDGESGSDNIKNRSDSVSSKDEKIGGKQLLHKSGKDVIHERKKKQREPTDLDEDNMAVDSVKEEDNDPYAAIKKELANIPLEDLVKIKDKLGLKVFSQIMQGGKKAEPNQKRVFKRENKNRPMEMSSKRPVPIIRQTHVPKKKVARDPRFDDLSGDFKEEYFERNYSFLQDVKAKEKEVIKKKLLKSKNEEKKEKLQYLLNRMNQQEKASQQKQRRKEIETTVKEKEKQLVKAGKNPYFLKKADRKKLELAEKYKELQKSGKVDQYLSRKRQKNAHKEKKKLPGKLARR